MHQFLTHFSYVGVVLVLLASGFGLPLPEDIPLLTAGYLCYLGKARLEFMIPLAFLAVVGADCIVYVLGRKYGHHVPKMPVLRRYLTEKRLAGAERAFHNHGGKTLFVARFLPGLRTACFFTAGIFKIPFWKFLVFDGAAALLSVPLLIWLGYWGGAKFEEVKEMAEDGQIAVVVVLVVLIAAAVGYKLWRARRKPSKADAPAA